MSDMNKTIDEVVEIAKSANEILDRTKVLSSVSQIFDCIEAAQATLSPIVDGGNTPVWTGRKSEVGIYASDGQVYAGPFIGPCVVWSPEQAEQFAEFLLKAAQQARKQVM